MNPSDLRPWPRAQNVLRPLNSAEREGLKASLERYGVRSSILALPDGRIIDGHHRHELAVELAIPCPHIEYDLAEEEAYRMAVELNTERRQLTAAERREAIRRLDEADPLATHTEIAAKIGASRQVVARERNKASAGSPNGHHAEPRRAAKATSDEKRQAYLLAEEGVSRAEIARRLGRPPTTISSWLRKAPPPKRDELERHRHERHLRNQAALAKLVDLNHRALQMWEGQAAIRHAIGQEPDIHALVALAGAIRRTQTMLAHLAASVEGRLGDEERERVQAFLIGSGFGT